MSFLSNKTFRFRTIAVAGLAAVGAITVAAPSASATDAEAYAVTAGGGFGLLDLTTGKYTSFGDMGFSSPDGLVKIGNTYYTGNAGEIFTVDFKTGAVTSVGTGTASILFIGSSSAGLFGVDGSGTLYGISTTTGADTSLGSTGLTISSVEYTLSTGFSALYLTNGTKGYIVSPTNGTAIELGSYKAGVGFGALANIGGVGYGAAISSSDDPTSEIYTADLATTTVTEISTVTPTVGQIYGIAAVPEPATWTMMLVGFGLLGATLRRRARVAGAA